MLAADVKRKNATCCHIFEHRAMLSVDVSNEATHHNITFSRCGNVASRCSKGKRGKMPPHQCALGSICGVFGLSLGCHFEPKGGAEGAFLNIWECWQSMFKTKNATCYHIFEHRAMLSVGVFKEEGSII